MDPITTAIVSALMAGIFSGFTDVGKAATIAAYAKLKDVLNKKFGARSGVMPAIAQLESKPDSPSRRAVLQEELTTVNAWRDAEVMAAAEHLHTLVLQQQQNISLQGSPVQGSINQVWGSQYQVDASGLVGPGVRRGTRRVTSILLIVVGLLVSIPAAGMLPGLNSTYNAMGSGPGTPQSFTDAINGQATSAHIIIYTMIGIGILMIIGGIWLMRRNVRKS